MRTNYTLFSRPLFILGLTLLIVNDFYLKYTFPGIITGKLSDFAGLFIFPYFFSVFFEKRTKIIYMATALFFMYWKLEIAQPFIDWLSSVSNITFYRTVDSTDWIALLILPVSYRYFKQELALPAKGSLAINFVIILISAFSFVATSRARSMPSFEVNLSSGKEFIVPYGKERIIKEYSSFTQEESGDTYDYFPIENTAALVDVEIELKEYDKTNTIIILKRIINYQLDTDEITRSQQEDIARMMKFTAEDFEKNYEKHLIEEFGSVRTLPKK
ncbi:hypothetical protein NAT51_17770 [Flavobacterium amniphilum]|uniref:hypothetical protein n=1 Tax=Flavobacterium amniphilum TaxID=1834035 RepID=UPI002029B83F|nr:hypothetical protein [Flavobacterium amniphilum]MCL9807380.1 hypothetical protein [Flavobacterium amniphilum]